MNDFLWRCGCVSVNKPKDLNPKHFLFWDEVQQDETFHSLFPDKAANLADGALGIDLPVVGCRETISLSAPSSPGVCSCSHCPAAIHTPGKPWREGKGEEWKRRGGESQQGTPHVRSVRFPLSGGLSPFYGRSESKVKRRRGSTRLPLSSCCTRSTFLSLPSSSVAVLSPREIRARIKAEVWTSPRACHDSLGFTEILLASLSPKAIPPSDPTPNPEAWAPCFVFLRLSKQSWEPVRPGPTEATAEDKHFTSRILLLYKEPPGFRITALRRPSKHSTSSLVRAGVKGRLMDASGSETLSVQ